MKRRTYDSIDAYLHDTNTTQRDLAQRLGITQSALSMIKNGQRLPSPKLALHIHELIGVPLDRLLRGAA